MQLRLEVELGAGRSAGGKTGLICSRPGSGAEEKYLFKSEQFAAC